MKKLLKKFIPNILKSTLKKIYYFSIVLIDKLMGQNNILPRGSMFFIRDKDYTKTGQEFKNFFTELANLQPSDQVLDIGCGFGRMAVPLTNYLSQEGGYWGFDIINDAITWCNIFISPRFRNFHFLHSDVYNKYYNPNGKVRARNYQFPFDKASFDFVYLTSVFTHMLPSDVENYMSEISRVLKTGGKCLITFFILNQESENLINSGRSTQDFRYKMDGYLTINDSDPEAAIAYNEEFIIGLFNKYGLKISKPIHYGSWCKRDNFLSYQDLIIAQKIIK
ncbi:MAG TPA: class I SAM-dependent methyltransferase [Nitrospirota bacterium]|nr:class I SAM-dependent methyltransferase [Nitrospirota bacterium]